MSSVERPTEVVFYSSHPGEAEAKQALLVRHGIPAQLIQGPDPVTGLGGSSFGDGTAQFFRVEVPRAPADRAREILDTEPPVPEQPPPETARPPAARRRVTIGIFLLLVFMPLAGILFLLRFGEREPLLVWVWYVVVLVIGLVALTVWLRRRG